MSADPELFAILSPKARRWTVSTILMSGGDPAPGKAGLMRLRASDVPALEHYLRTEAAWHQSQGGMEGLTDTIIDSVIASIVRYYSINGVDPAMASGRADNAWLYKPVARAAWAWTRTRLAREGAGPTATLPAPIIRPEIERLVAQRLAEAGKTWDDGDARGVVDRVVEFCARMVLRKRRAVVRKGATKRVRDALTDEVIHITLLHEMGGYNGLLVPGRGGKLVPFKPAGPRGALSVSQIWFFHTHTRKFQPDGSYVWIDRVREARVGSDGRRNVWMVKRSTSRSAVASALRELYGTPRRQAIIDRQRSTVRDLIWAIENDLPRSTVSVVALEDLAGRLWARPRSAQALWNQKNRVAVALAEVHAAGVGINAAVAEGHAVIGKGRTLPSDLVKAVDQAVRKGKVRRITARLVPQRQSVWGTREGQDAQAGLRVATSRAGDEDVDRVARLAGYDGAEAMIEIAVGRTPERGMGLKRVAQPGLRDDTEQWAQAALNRMSLGVGVGDNGAATHMLDLVKTAREQGAGAVWRKIRRGPQYSVWLSGAAAAPARRRADHIERVLDKCSDVDDWGKAVHADVLIHRPGRRHTVPLRRFRTPQVCAEPIHPQRQNTAMTTKTKTMPATPRPMMPTRIEGDFYLAQVFEDRRLSVERDILVETFYGRAPQVISERPFLRADGTPATFRDGRPMIEVETDRAAMWIDDPSAAMARLRSVYHDLRPQTLAAAYFPVTRAINEAVGGAVLDGIGEAGQALRAAGPLAVIRSKQFFEAVIRGLQSEEAALTLRWHIDRLRQAFEDPNVAVA
ncbi:hypothetical protein [Microvirga sp. G4-2]|uniref:hypothetical protein n=1 Tax=Microvirga sp. G4-2 TaxID=3434467 RepID=UPI004043EC49